jgi:acyl-CoA reductase-like NAD-dependent aldehyde dehydrogenase
MLEPTYPLYVANQAFTRNTDLEVLDKGNNEVAARVPLADKATFEHAIAEAVKAAPAMRRMPAYKRRDILSQIRAGLEGRAEELSAVLTIEAGKTKADAEGEVKRAIDTARLAEEEATRWGGELQPLDISERAEGYQGIWKRVPVGVCGFITPFNFPLNLVMHKVAPALAVGCPFILKPASKTPVSALILGEILAGAGLPEGAFSVLPARRVDAEPLITDPRIALLSFTGSPAVGWTLRGRAGRKKVLLELGGNAAAVVERDADIDHAVERLLTGAFYQSGQSCISVQRILIHASLYERLSAELVARTRKLKVGPPFAPDTFVGPLISEEAAARVAQWIDEAVTAGARVLVGGARKGALVWPTLLENVPADARLRREEAFGPVAILERFSSFDEALASVNDSEYGLQAGVFTRDLHRAFRAFDELEVGGVVIGDVPSVRVDSMPYGGVKKSGAGREGVRFAMEEMSEIRLMVLKGAGQHSD